MKLEIAFLWLAIGIGVLLRFTDLSFPDFATDEAQFALAATQAWTPLGMHIVTWAQNTFGHTILIARGTSVVFGLALLPIIYFLTREITDEHTSHIATTIAALFPSHILFSRLAYPTILLCTAWIVTLFCFLKAVRTGHWAWFFALFLTSAAATMMKSQGLLLPIMLMIGCIIQAMRDLKRNYPFSILHYQTAIVLLLSLIPVFLYLLTHPGVLATVFLYGGNMYGISDTGTRIVHLLSTWWNLLGLFFIAVILSLSQLKKLPWPIIVQIGIAGGIGFLLGPSHEYYVTHLVIFSIPIAMFFTALRSSLRRYSLVVLLIATLLVLGPRDLFLNSLTHPLYQREGYWNAHANALNEALRGEDSITVLGFPGHHIRWYLEPQVLVGRHLTPPYTTPVVLVLKNSIEMSEVIMSKVNIPYEDETIAIIRQ